MAVRRILTDAERQEIISLFVDGGTVHGLAKQYGCSTPKISQLLSEAGVPRRPTGGQRRFSPTEEAEIAAAYSKGASSDTLTRRYGCSIWLIRRIAREHGHIINGVGIYHAQLRGEAVDEVVALWTEQGLPIQQIADKFDVSYTVIRGVLHQQGIVIPNRRRLKEVRTNGRWILVHVAANDPMAVMARSSGFVFQHRLVMARHLGRPLTGRETVHHIDGDTGNNDLSNLQLRQGQHGRGVMYACVECGSRNVVTVPLD